MPLPSLPASGAGRGLVVTADVSPGLERVADWSLPGEPDPPSHDEVPEKSVAEGVLHVHPPLPQLREQHHADQRAGRKEQRTRTEGRDLDPER